MAAGPGGSTDADEPRERKISKETIHSGHFMVSDFEAEAEDEEGIEVPDPTGTGASVEEIQGVMGINQGGVVTYAKPVTDTPGDSTTVSIDVSLTKLFKTMSLAYRQNITSPKWNRFKGVRLRWKDKIRLNNVIWRCWHMQYIQKKSMTFCQFALDVDMHNRPEAVVLEGKYWKRRLRAVTAEYKKWRLFYKNSLSGMSPLFDQGDMAFMGFEEMDWAGSFFSKPSPTTFEEGNLLDSLDFTDMLFSPFLTSPQLFPFPNPREIARGTGNSDLLQPGLVQLQPDLMDYDMIDIHEMLAGRGLPTVPEEDFFPDVEDTVGLPPSSSPPSISTPTPIAHTEYSSRHTSLAHPFSNQPSSPQLYSPQETFIPSREPPPPTAHVPPISPQQLTSEQEFEYDLRQEGSHRPFARSRSAQDLHSGSTNSKNGPQQDSHMGSFVVPKSTRKKKYYGGSSSSWTPISPVSTSAPAVASSNSLVFPSSVSPPNQMLSTFSGERPQHAQISHSHSAPPLSTVNAIEIHTPTTESNIFAHILSSESYKPSNNQPPPSPQLPSKIKVARISPRPYPDVTSAPTPSTGKLNSSSNTMTAVSGSHQPYFLPNVSLSAVTPSSIKAIHPHAPSTPTLNWTSSSASRPLKILKASPPYPEPNSPTSAQTLASSPPNKPFRPKNDVERVQYKEHRRVCHINAEQKRRCNIKNNFEMLHSLVPAVNQNPNAKVSKATMLHKGAEYIMQMKQERQQLSDQAEQLRNQIETLSSEISLAQSMLPATGAGMRPTRHNKIKEKFDAYVRERTLANPKYYVLALIAQPLLQTYNSSVSTASVDDLCRSSMAWLDQHCTLNVLRPVVSNAMRKLSVTTNILTTPETLYEDIFRQVTKQEGGKLSQFTSSESR